MTVSSESHPEAWRCVHGVRWRLLESYALARQEGLASPIGLLVLFGWTFSFAFHLLNGVRHLFWDAGKGFERKARHASGWFAVLGAIALTLCVVAWIWPRLS